MKLFNRTQEPTTEVTLEEVVFEEDQIFAEELDKVIASVPMEYAKEKLSELDQMIDDTKEIEEAESKQK